jgi:hypothetical protein
MKLIAGIGLLATAATFAACETRLHPVGWRDALADGSVIGGEGSDGGTDGASPPADPVPVPLAISAREALTRVARVLWESAPDSALVAMADSGGVATDADVRKIALDMLADPRSRAGVGHFYRWWLELDRAAAVQKDAALFPQFSPAVGALMASETEALGVDVTLNGDGRFPSLMRASHSFLNETLAAFYGVPGVTGSDLRKVDLDPTQRSGIFTQLSLLTLTASSNSWTSPSRRGVLIVRKMLCMNSVPPPESLEQPAPVTQPSLTNRQRIEMTVSSQAACTLCHQQFDPFGFAYERFDSIGRVRLTDSGMPIDTSGHVSTPNGDAFSFDGPIELAAILANLPSAHRCMSSQWLEYTLGRTLTAEDAPSVTGIHERFQASSLNLRTLIAAAVSSSAFLSEAGGARCTPGLDQTCNDEPFASWTTGTCTPAGKCVCDANRTLNVTTGRCR